MVRRTETKCTRRARNRRPCPSCPLLTTIICMAMRYLIAAIALILCSCSPQQRLQKLLKKHPELTANSIVVDSFIVSKYTHDTTIQLYPDGKCDSFFIRDSFIIETPRFTTKGKIKNGKLTLNTQVKDTTGKVQLQFIPVEKKVACKRHPIIMAISFTLGFVFCSILMLLKRR